MNEQALIRKIEEQAKKFKSRAAIGHGDQKRHDLVQADEQKSMWTARKRLGWSFPKIGSDFHRDPRTTERAVQSYEETLTESDKVSQQPPAKVLIEQKPYEETPHKQKMRELAKALAGKIILPVLLDTYLLRDLPIEFLPGKYQLTIGTVEISGDKIKVNYYDISAGIAASHLVKGLYSHLNSSELSKFTELVGDKGKLNNWIGQVGQYFEVVISFLKLIADEVKGYRAKVSLHDDAKPGLTKWFIITPWYDAIQKAAGYSWIDDSWYKPHESIPNTNLWQLKCGAYAIGIARSERTLKTYENWHKKLRVKYAKHRLAKDIASRSRELTDIAHEIQQRLQEFSDRQYLCGHCDLC